jgi:hypothetical protein
MRDVKRMQRYREVTMKCRNEGEELEIGEEAPIK